MSFLEKFNDEVKVCLFLRNPVNYYRSAQQQVIKAWSQFAEVGIIEYHPGVDSLKYFATGPELILVVSKH